MILFFDTHCTMCTRVARLLRVMFGVELQDAWIDKEAKEAMLEKETWTLIKNGNYYYRSDVIRELFLSKWFTYPLGELLKLTYISKYMDRLYGYIARHRCENEICQ